MVPNHFERPRRLAAAIVREIDALDDIHSRASCAVRATYVSCVYRVSYRGVHGRYRLGMDVVRVGR